MKKLKNQKIKVISLLAVAVLLLGGVGVVVVKSMMPVDYKRQYTQEEWSALSPKKRKRIQKARMCDPDDGLDALGLKCDKQ